MREINLAKHKKPLKLKIKTKTNEYIVTTIGKKSRTGTISALPDEIVTINGTLVGEKMVQIGYITVGYPLEIMRHETLKGIFCTDEVVAIRRLKN